MRIFILSTLLFALCVPVLAESIPSPVTTEVQKTQHFEKFMMSNKLSVPVTLVVNAEGRNLKLSHKMPHIIVIPPRSTKEAFHASPKDPRAYYSRPDVSVDHQFGDYRLTRSNLPLTLPWKKGESFEVKSVKSSGSISFKMDSGADVTAARKGLVVSIEGSGLVIAHDDGSITRYKNLNPSGVDLGKEVAAGRKIGTAKKKALLFQLAVPGRDLKFKALTPKFKVGGSKTVLKAGTSYKR